MQEIKEEKAILSAVHSVLHNVEVPPSLDWYRGRSENFFQFFSNFDLDLNITSHGQEDWSKLDEITLSGLVVIGGSLKVETLLEAYTRGIFPWYETAPIEWYSPFWRAVFPLQDTPFKLSKSFNKFLKKHPYQIRFDTRFNEVIRACAAIKRKDQHGTWITEEMQRAYSKLHRLGLAHSVEIYRIKPEEELVGGLYGISLGNSFFGESMFSKQPNTSKLALYHLHSHLKKQGFTMIDCQLPTAHLSSLGAVRINRGDYLSLLKESNQHLSRIGKWSETSD